MHICHCDIGNFIFCLHFHTQFCFRSGEQQLCVKPCKPSWAEPGRTLHKGWQCYRKGGEPEHTWMWLVLDLYHHAQHFYSTLWISLDLLQKLYETPENIPTILFQIWRATALTPQPTLILADISLLLNNGMHSWHKYWCLIDEFSQDSIINTVTMLLPGWWWWW